MGKNDASDLTANKIPDELIFRRRTSKNSEG
jgi:hypothetical protein